MTMEEDITFEAGGRYRNRLGWYEVLEIDGEHLRVRYESDGREDLLAIQRQQRILLNISQEEDRVTPYRDEDRNRAYFYTLGYLANNGFIEAIIPPKCRNGFDNTFRRIKGRYPRQQEEGYYLHNDPNVDKWGTEMRLTFRIPRTISPRDLEFPPGTGVVESPKAEERRINNNAFCWQLLGLGFELGRDHDTGTIEANIPEMYRADFQNGSAAE